ncbi:MAG: S8 family serine peptidase [Verrucomicrobia bacterium]|nr:S8 family serine peptidase [Verrucomicrobiota bacterium]
MSPVSRRPGSEAYRADRILIQLKPGAAPDQVNATHRRLGNAVRRHLAGAGDIQAIQLPVGASVQSHIEAYIASGLVAVAEPDFWVRPAAGPDDPYFLNGDQWHLNNTGQDGGVSGADIHALEGWETLNSASNVIVAIIDTGILASHPDLAGNLWTNPGEIPGNGIDDDGDGIVDDVHGLNAASNSGDIQDVVGHGTFVAGLIGAVGNNGAGVSGVAWNVQLMMCRFVDNAGNGSVSDVIQCFDYARTKGAKVINASFVGTNFSSTLLAAINNCRNAGIVVVAGVGNEGADNDILPGYPASYNLDNIIAVAATDRSDQLASFSNYGATNVDLAAPGEAITSTRASGVNPYSANSGTSFSTAIMSGAIALLRARYPGLSPSQLIHRAMTTVDPLPSLSGNCVSGGRLNLGRALGPPVIADFTRSISLGSPPVSIQFTDASFGSITQWAWDFDDGSTSVAQNPAHIFLSAGSYSVKLTVSDASGHVGSTNLLVEVVENYQITAGPYSWIDPTGMPTVVLAQNGVSDAIPLPFSFLFYGQSKTTVYMGANGLLGFDPTSLNASVNTDLPNSAAPNGIICPFWDALTPAAGTKFYAGLAGMAPNRRFVASWVGVNTTGPKSATLTFQCVLEEGSNRILFQYEDVAPASKSGSASGKAASVGVENGTGLVAARYSYNGSAALSNTTTLVFVPPSVPVGSLLVSHSPGLTATGPVGGPFAPTSQVYTLTNAGTASLTWTGSVTQPWLTLSSSMGTLAPGERMVVTLSINDSVSAFGAGPYSALVQFEDASVNEGGFADSIRLTVLSVPRVSIEQVSGSPDFNIAVLGDPSARYRVDGSTDLVVWTPVATGDAGPDGMLVLRQELSGLLPLRFYRAVAILP